MTIKEMRTNIGLSQVELAQMSGINLRSLQDYEQGHKAISSAKGETLYKLSQALGYSIEDIITGASIDIDTYDNNKLGVTERIQAYENMLARRRQTIVHFPVIISDNLVDMSRIYPTKQRMVKAVIDDLRGDLRISSLRLFGSSITMRCHRDSDLDFAVGLNEIGNSVKNEISERIQLCCDWGADILWLDRVTSEDRIYKDIMGGLVIL